MIQNRKIRRKLTILTVTLALTSSQPLYPLTVGAQAPAQQNITGELNASGNVNINGVRAMAGDTITDSTVLMTDCRATAAVNLGRQGRIELGQGTDITMSLKPGNTGGDLRKGTVILSTPAGVAISVVTPDGIVTTDGRDAAVITIDRTLGNTRVISQRGDAKITAGNKVEFVSSGQDSAVGAQSRNANPCGGAYPTDSVPRAGNQGAGAGAGGGNGSSIPGSVGLLLGLAGAVAATTVGIVSGNGAGQGSSGSSVVLGTTGPNGTIVIPQPDGSVTTIFPNGRVDTLLPNGTIRSRLPNGLVTQTTNGVTTVVETPPGTTTTQNPNGTTTLRLPDGTTVTTGSGGAVTGIVDPNGNSLPVTVAG